MTINLIAALVPVVILWLLLPFTIVGPLANLPPNVSRVVPIATEANGVRLVSYPGKDNDEGHHTRPSEATNDNRWSNRNEKSSTVRINRS